MKLGLQVSSLTGPGAARISLGTMVTGGLGSLDRVPGLLGQLA